MIGALFAQTYEVKRLLGEGGMGAVYEAVHRPSGKCVALKVVSAELAQDPESVRRFHREARAATRIDSPHIVQVLDVGVDGKRPFLVMDRLVGRDLERTIRRMRVLSPHVALRVAAQACMGLARAHEAGIIHRDVKSANLFLAESETGEITVKLLDFGIAKVKDPNTNSYQLTRTGTVLGSPAYMSPEQTLAEASIDQRTDVWSMGIVLYEMLTGRTPYGHHPSIGRLAMAICGEPHKPVRDWAPWVPADVAAIVDRALCKKAKGRYPGAQQMLEAILPHVSRSVSLHTEELVPEPALGNRDTEWEAHALAETEPASSSAVAFGLSGTQKGRKGRAAWKYVPLVALPLVVIGVGSSVVLRTRLQGHAAPPVRVQLEIASAPQPPAPTASADPPVAAIGASAETPARHETPSAPKTSQKRASSGPRSPQPARAVAPPTPTTTPEPTATAADAFKHPEGTNTMN